MPSIFRGAVLLLGLPLSACVRATVPPPQPPPPVDVAEVEAQLDRAAALLTKAEADGRLSADECSAVTEAFRATYEPGQPSTAQGLFDAGVVWERCGDVTQATAAYRETLAVAPAHAGAHNNLGVLQWTAGDRMTAAASFERAVQADPTAPAARNNHAAALRERYVHSGSKEDFERAEQALRSALAVDSDNPVSHENLARLYYDRGRLHDRSYLLLSKLVVTQATRVLEERQTTSAELYNLRGLLLMEDGDQVSALQAFERATEIDPEHSEAHLNVAMIALRFRDYATAERSLAQALQDDRYRTDVTALLGLGVAQRGLRRYDDAKQTLTRARDLDDRDPRALFNLGVLLHDHVAPASTQTEVTTEPFNARPYLDARGFFERFAKSAGNRYPREVADARLRMASIDQFLADIKELERLRNAQSKLEALAEREHQEERKRLLELERRAKEAQSAAESGS